MRGLSEPPSSVGLVRLVSASPSEIISRLPWRALLSLALSLPLRFRHLLLALVMLLARPLSAAVNFTESPRLRAYGALMALRPFQPSAPDLQMYLQSKEAGLCLISAILMWEKTPREEPSEQRDF